MLYPLDGFRAHFSHDVCGWDILLDKTDAGSSVCVLEAPVPDQRDAMSGKKGTHAQVTIRELSPACLALLNFLTLSSKGVPLAWSSYDWPMTALPS